MGTLYNRSGQTYKRRLLRKNLTKAERKLWLLLKNRQLSGYKFRRQFGIGEYIVDFYCPRLKLVVEVDGGYHQSSLVSQYDRNKESQFHSLDITVLRVKNEEVLEQQAEVLGKIKQVISTIPPHILGRCPRGRRGQ